MEVLEAIAKRYSCRKFTSENISERNIQTILKAGMQAAVASGAYDSLQITVIQDKTFLNEIGEAVSAMIEKMIGRKMDKNFGEAALVIVSSKPAAMTGIEMANAGCVLENMAIAATSLGIDNIIHGGASAMIAKNPEMMKRLNLPKGFMPVLAASFGYAVTKEKPKEHTILVNRI